MTEMDDLIEWFEETERQIADAESLTSDLDRLREQQRDHKVIFLTIHSFLNLAGYLTFAFHI
jgi:hypothetical protein